LKFFRPLTEKYIYYAEDLPFSDQFRQLIPKLRKEFLDHYAQLELPLPDGTNVSSQYHLTQAKNGWRSRGIKYNGNWEDGEEIIKEQFPTAHKLVSTFGTDCPLASYSVLMAGGNIGLHNGDKENYDSTYLRVHIPLIVPDTNPNVIGLEVMGEKVGWNDVWAFMNTGLHTAWNKSDQHRLVFIIDIHKGILGLKPYKPRMFKNQILEYLRLYINRMLRTIWFFCKGMLTR